MLLCCATLLVILFCISILIISEWTRTVFSCTVRLHSMVMNNVSAFMYFSCCKHLQPNEMRCIYKPVCRCRNTLYTFPIVLKQQMYLSHQRLTEIKWMTFPSSPSCLLHVAYRWILFWIRTQKCPQKNAISHQLRLKDFSSQLYSSFRLASPHLVVVEFAGYSLFPFVSLSALSLPDHLYCSRYCHYQ